MIGHHRFAANRLAAKAARLVVLEVANLICFLQGYLALASGREPAHDVIPWPDRWAWRHLTRRGQLVAVHVRVVPLVEAGIVRAQRPLMSGLGLGLTNVSGL